jgi:tetratricopeptide (TPR) repeat protein
MTTPTFDRIKELSAACRYSEALIKLQEIETEGIVSAELLVWKARILQLVDDGGSLDEVETTLERAIELDKTCIPALLELGWFRLNVQNDSRQALQSFQAALKLQVPANTEAIIGLLKCMQELEPNNNLEEVKTRAVLALVDEMKVTEALQ